MDASRRAGHRMKGWLAPALVVGVLCITQVAMAAGDGAGGDVAAAGHDAAAAGVVRWDLAVAIAASIGLSSLAAGYAVAKVGAAALGAAAEKPELLTRSLVFVALGEGLAVFGFLIALLVVLKL